jgi:hypothetical protein
MAHHDPPSPLPHLTSARFFWTLLNTSSLPSHCLHLLKHVRCCLFSPRGSEHSRWITNQYLPGTYFFLKNVYLYLSRTHFIQYQQSNYVRGKTMNEEKNVVVQGIPQSRTPTLMNSYTCVSEARVRSCNPEPMAPITLGFPTPPPPRRHQWSSMPVWDHSQESDAVPTTQTVAMICNRRSFAWEPSSPSMPLSPTSLPSSFLPSLPQAWGRALMPGCFAGQTFCWDDPLHVPAALRRELAALVLASPLFFI